MDAARGFPFSGGFTGTFPFYKKYWSELSSLQVAEASVFSDEATSNHASTRLLLVGDSIFERLRECLTYSPHLSHSPICHTRPFVPICHTPHFSLGGSSYGLESAKWSKLPALLKSQMQPLFTDPPLVLAIAGDQTQHVLWRLHHGELPGISLILPGLRSLVDPHRHRALTPPPPECPRVPIRSSRAHGVSFFQRRCATTLS